MALKLGKHTVDRVLVVDDDESARQGYSYSIEDLGLKPILQSQRLQPLSHFVAAVRKRADAVFSDYRLRIGSNYAAYDGDALVAACYKRNIPAVLCTTFTDVDSLVNRRHLRYIPVLLRTNNPEPDAIAEGFRQCISEFAGNFLPTRKPWRTLVRVFDIDTTRKECHVVIPGWDMDKKILLHLESIPISLRREIQPGKRLHAQVNLGADGYSGIYFDKWEKD